MAIAIATRPTVAIELPEADPVRCPRADYRAMTDAPAVREAELTAYGASTGLDWDRLAQLATCGY